MKIAGMDNNCVLVGAQYLTNKPDEEIIGAAFKYGEGWRNGKRFPWTPGHGLLPMTWVPMLRSLGLELTPMGDQVAKQYADCLSNEKIEAHASVQNPFRELGDLPNIYEKKTTERGFFSLPVTLTLSRFLEICDKHAVYIVCTHRHLLVVNRGVIHDPNMIQRSNRRRVERVLRVENPQCLPKNRGQYIRRTRKKWKKTGKAFERFHPMCMFVNTYEKVTIEQFRELAKKVGYNQSSLEYDLRRGFLEIYGD
jgi:hypothetical protein